MQFVILAAVVAVAMGTPQLGGSSTAYRAQDNVGNYNFGYNEAHSTGGTFRRESGSAGVKIGSYGLTDADGRQRVVNYIADANGFRATISSNEQGVDGSKDPADTQINGSPLGYSAGTPVVSYAAVPAAPGNFAPGVQVVPGSPVSYSSVVQHGPGGLYNYVYRY